MKVKRKGSFTLVLYLLFFSTGWIFCSNQGKESQKSGAKSPMPVEKTQDRRLIGPTKSFKEVIAKLKSIDFYPEKRDSIFYTIDVKNRWLFNELGDSAFKKVKNIWAVSMKKTSSIIDGSLKYYPDAIIEEWHFNNIADAKNTLKALDNTKNSDEIYFIYFKAPTIWWQDKERIYFLHTRAEMFRSYLLKIEKIVKDAVKME